MFPYNDVFSMDESVSTLLEQFCKHAMTPVVTALHMDMTTAALNDFTPTRDTIFFLKNIVIFSLKLLKILAICTCIYF